MRHYLFSHLQLLPNRRNVATLSLFPHWQNVRMSSIPYHFRPLHLERDVLHPWSLITLISSIFHLKGGSSVLTLFSQELLLCGTDYYMDAFLNIIESQESIIVYPHLLFLLPLLSVRSCTSFSRTLF